MHETVALLKGPDESSTAHALAALQAEVRCIKHTRALQRGDPHWTPDSEGPDARISQLEGQLAQMEVGKSVCASVCMCVSASMQVWTTLYMSQQHVCSHSIVLYVCVCKLVSSHSMSTAQRLVTSALVCPFLFVSVCLVTAITSH